MENIIEIIKKGNITNEIAAQLYKENINNYDIIKLLLHNNIYQNIIDGNKKYPINYCNNIDIYKLLYLNDNYIDKSQLYLGAHYFFLNKALIYCNNIDILYFLLEKGAIIDNLYFMNTENIELLEYILKNKLKNELDNDILFYENSIEKLNLYIKYNNINEDILDKDTINNLTYNSIKVLLDNINVPKDILFDLYDDGDIETYHKIIELFLNKGVDINYIKYGKNLLFNLDVHDKNYYNNVVFLVSKGININHKYDLFNILYHYYLKVNIIDKKIIDLYMSYGLSLNDLTKYNRNILFYLNYDDQIIKLDELILNYKININIKDIYGNTPLHYIFEKYIITYIEDIESYLKYIENFLKYINVNELNNNKDNILHILCRQYTYYNVDLEFFEKMSEFLINKYNVDIYQENEKHLTPYDILSSIKLNDNMKYLYTELQSNTKSSNKKL